MWATKKEIGYLKSLLKKIKIADPKGNDIYEKLSIKITDSKGTVLIDKHIDNGAIYEMLDYYLADTDL